MVNVLKGNLYYQIVIIFYELFNWTNFFDFDWVILKYAW